MRERVASRTHVGHARIARPAEDGEYRGAHQFNLTMQMPAEKNMARSNRGVGIASQSNNELGCNTETGMRERATVLLVRHQSVLLVRERGGPWLLPGGAVAYDELTIIAAIRTLHEDIGVEANAVAFLFQQMSAQHLHHVFRIAIADDVQPRPSSGGRLHELLWVDATQLTQISATPGTRAILTRAMGGARENTRSAWNHDGGGQSAAAGFGRRWR
jgi:8-oxo-dGTP diphosphatase